MYPAEFATLAAAAFTGVSIGVGIAWFAVSQAAQASKSELRHNVVGAARELAADAAEFATSLGSAFAQWSSHREKAEQLHAESVSEAQKADRKSYHLARHSQSCAWVAHDWEWHNCLRHYKKWFSCNLQGSYRVWQREVPNSPLPVYRESLYWVLHEPYGVVEQARALCHPELAQGGEYHVRLAQVCEKWDFALYNVYATESEHACEYSEACVAQWSGEKRESIRIYGGKAKELRAALRAKNGFLGVKEGDLDLIGFVHHWETELGPQEHGWPTELAFEELKYITPPKSDVAQPTPDAAQPEPESVAQCEPDGAAYLDAFGVSQRG